MAEDVAAQRMLEWVTNASPAEVAAELMAAFATTRRVYGIMPLIEWLFREYPNPKRYSSALRGHQQQRREPIREAVQLLRHEAVADLLGHSSSSITGDVYGHTSDQAARGAVDGVERSAQALSLP
jgi:integrase